MLTCCLLQLLLLAFEGSYAQGQKLINRVGVVVVSNLAAPDDPSTPTAAPSWRWSGTGDRESIEVDSEWIKTTSNVRLLVDDIFAAKVNNITINPGPADTVGVVSDDNSLRNHLTDMLAKPLIQDRSNKLEEWLQDLEKEHADQLRECRDEKECREKRCVWRKGGDKRRDGLLNERCISPRNMLRYRLLTTDRDLIAQDMKVVLRTADTIPWIASARLAGDWSCTALRKGAAGCPTSEIAGIFTTSTQTYVKTVVEEGKETMQTWLSSVTVQGTQALHADHPLITGTLRWGPDKEQVEDPNGPVVTLQ